MKTSAKLFTLSALILGACFMMNSCDQPKRNDKVAKDMEADKKAAEEHTAATSMPSSDDEED